MMKESKVMLCEIRNGKPCENLEASYPYIQGACHVMTFGLKQHYDHPEIELVLDISESDTKLILSHLARKVAKGHRFQPGDVFTDVPGYQAIRIDASTTYGGSFRATLPDEHGLWPEDKESAPLFKLQSLPLHLLERHEGDKPVPDFVIDDFARLLLPKIQKYYESEEGQQAFEKMAREPQK